MSERSAFLSATSACAALALLLTAAPLAQAQQKIICWNDKAGKVVGCGDRVPPEFQQNESKTLSSRGITVETTASAQEAALLKEEAQKKATVKVEEDRRIAEQRRQDSALVNTYTSDKEIDQRRDREVQVVDLQLVHLKSSLKNAVEAEAVLLKRNSDIAKSGKPVSASVADELNRATDERKRVEARVAEKDKDKAAIITRYAEQKARYIELRGGSTTTTQPAPAPATKK